MFKSCFTIQLDTDPKVLSCFLCDTTFWNTHHRVRQDVLYCLYDLLSHFAPRYITGSRGVFMPRLIPTKQTLTKCTHLAPFLISDSMTSMIKLASSYSVM